MGNGLTSPCDTWILYTLLEAGDVGDCFPVEDIDVPLSLLLLFVATATKWIKVIFVNYLHCWSL